MLGIDPLTVSTLLVLAAGGRTLECPDHSPTKINMVPRTEDVTYDRSKSLKELQGYRMDTVDPYSFHGQTITQAFMDGQIALESKIKFGQAVMKDYGAACLWYDEITIELNIDPTIVIAKEIYADPCMRKAVLGHELKHVRVDREIVNLFANSIGKKLYKELKSRGFTAGPFKVEDAKVVSGKMQHVVQQILDLEYQKLGIVRTERQRDVDNLDEYNRVGDLCPAFAKKKAKLYSGLGR